MRSIRLILILVIFVLGSMMISAQDKKPVERVVVPLTNPNQPVFLEAGLHNGGITVKGYKGNEVIVEATVRTREHRSSDTVIERARERVKVRMKDFARKYNGKDEKDKKDKIAGMKKLTAFNTSLTIEELNNRIEVSTESFRQTVDLMIQVPYNTSLELSAHNYGDIRIENVKGKFSISNHNGSIFAHKVSGSLVANSHNGEIETSFVQFDTENPSSFSTWNGDIDVSFPQATKASLKMKTRMGEIYSDFDVKMVPYSKTRKKEKKDGRGRLVVSYDQGMLGRINGGGQEITMTTYNGDIFVRKTK